MVSQCLHVGVAPRRIVALGIRRPHVGRILADHIGNSSFVLDHLLLPHVGRDAGQAIMGPRMGGNLVTFIDHALEQVGPGSRGIDSTLSEIVSGHVERRREAKLFQEIQEFRSVNVWTIIIGQSHDVGLGAAVDVLIKGDLPQARPWIGEGGSSLGRGVGVAPTELPLAIWIPTIILFRATVPLQQTVSTGFHPQQVLGSKEGWGGRDLLRGYSIGLLDIWRRQRNFRIWPFLPGRYIGRTGFDIQCHNSRWWNRKTFFFSTTVSGGLPSQFAFAFSGRGGRNSPVDRTA